MFTVSFICQRVLRLIGIWSCNTGGIKFAVAAHYTTLRSIYKLFHGSGVICGNYFIQTCGVLSRLFDSNVHNFYVVLVLVLFRINRLGSYYTINTHSTNRNSDVLYLDRFVLSIQTQVVRRMGCVYSIISTLTPLAVGAWVVRFSPTTVVKYVNSTCTDIFNILYLRKTKVFNKGRYSRNRQFYRTGVYWCLYINIIAVIGMYFWFYRFVMNFGYLWWLFYLSLASFVAAKTLHFRLYTVANVYNSITLDLVWFATCLNVFTEMVIVRERAVKGIFFKNFSFLPNTHLLFGRNVLNALLIKSNLYYVFLWFYNPTSYYVRSLTIKQAKIFLNVGKISYWSQFKGLLFR